MFGNGNYSGLSAGDISALTAAADAWSSGNKATAFAWLDNDIRQGTRNGTTGSLTLLGYASAQNGTGVYPAFESAVASYDGRAGGNLTVECYEGGLECLAPTTTQCTSLGISTTYSATLATMLAEYKTTFYAYKLARDQMLQFMSQPHSVSPSWFQFVNNSQWGFRSASVYETDTYQMGTAILHVNTGKRRFQW